MPRSVKLRADVISKVQTIVHHNFYCQNDLADELGFAQSTISNFINGKPVDRRKFQDICEKLGIEDWRKLAEVPQQHQSVDRSPLTDALSASTASTTSPAAHSIQNVVLNNFSLEAPEGSVPLNSAFYIQRLPQETYCQEEIVKPHALIRLKAPRQMGKTSMMMRLLHQAEQQGDRVVYLSLEQSTAQALNDADRLLYWFCASISMKTQHKFQQEDYTNLIEMVGGTLGTQEYFESYLLPDLAVPLTIGLDAVDRIFDYPHLYDNFFSLLRSLHEAGKHTGILSKLRLVVSHAAEVYIPIDINRSPFNVGISVEFSEFTAAQMQLLAAQHQLNWKSTEIDKLMKVIGGHPFLVRLAMFEVASGKIDLSGLIASAAGREGIFYQRHLARMETTLNSQPDLLTAMTSILRPAATPLTPRVKGHLEGLGLVKLQGDSIVPRCELYRQYFTNALLS
jgi:DNA-binding Xre family transcriptional regulator